MNGKAGISSSTYNVYDESTVSDTTTTTTLTNSSNFNILAGSIQFYIQDPSKAKILLVATVNASSADDDALMVKKLISDLSYLTDEEKTYINSEGYGYIAKYDGNLNSRYIPRYVDLSDFSFQTYYKKFATSYDGDDPLSELTYVNRENYASMKDSDNNTLTSTSLTNTTTNLKLKTTSDSETDTYSYIDTMSANDFTDSSHNGYEYALALGGNTYLTFYELDLSTTGAGIYTIYSSSANVWIYYVAVTGVDGDSYTADTTYGVSAIDFIYSGVTIVDGDFVLSSDSSAYTPTGTMIYLSTTATTSTTAVLVIAYARSSDYEGYYDSAKTYTIYINYSGTDTPTGSDDSLVYRGNTLSGVTVPSTGDEYKSDTG